MTRAIATLILTGLILANAGCAVLRAEADSSKPVLLNNPDRVPTRSHFRADGVNVFFLWGLAGNDNRAINDALLKEAGDARGLVNVRVATYSSVLDLIVTSLTAGIIVPKSFTIEGDRV
jgi:hypothetical protein